MPARTVVLYPPLQYSQGSVFVIETKTVLVGPSLWMVIVLPGAWETTVVDLMIVTCGSCDLWEGLLVV